MVIDTPTLYSQIKDSYKTILVILGIAVSLQLVSLIQIEWFESYLITSTAITFFPLGVAISCFIISNMYGSKVFGKSYLMLGISYMLFFLGEALYYFYFEPFDTFEYSVISEIFFMVSMPLILGHIIINIRYFIERLESYQKFLLIIIPAIIIFGYSAIFTANPVEINDDFYFNLIFVIESSIVLGFTVVAFTLFRQTVLFAPWFLLLIGILFSTAGDTLYRYTDTIASYDYADPTTSLWLASSMIMIYALYKHQKSI